ncbi:MAG: serine/threonine-protein kinase, partial [Holophagales bacterium]|nr:serine/threonine-protein kinase [Holophagales bacterium]
ERQILAGMDHPGIARLLDGGITSDGRPWFALEHIEGVPLTRWCDEEQLGLEARLKLFSEVCEAVEYAHRNLVVHRDIKPSNILVDRAGRVRLLDFGIATLLGDESVPNETRTAARGRFITPGYGAPELVLGGRITTATDVYSLGIIFYELLSGRLPYRFEPGAPEHGDVARQALVSADSEPPELSSLAIEADPSGDPAEIRRRLGRELDTIARKAIRSEAERRYASAEALRDDVERYLSGEPVLACPDSLPYRLGKLARRHRAAFVAAILVTLSLLSGLGAALWQAGIAARERDLARQEVARTEEVKDFIIDLFRSTDPRELRGEELTAQRLLDRGLERVRSGLDSRPVLRVELLTTIAEASKLIGDYERAEAVLVEALAIDVGPDPRHRLQVAAASNGLAEVYANLKRNAEAEAHHRRALAIRLEVDEPYSLDTAQSYNNLAVALADQGKLAEAITMYGHALHIQEVARGEGDPQTLVTLGNLGTAHRLLGHYREAEGMLRTAIERMSRHHGDDHPSLVWHQSQLASISRRLGDFGEAERLLRRSLDLAREIYGEPHPTTLHMMNNYAMIAHALGEDAEAAALMQKTLALNLEQYGPEHLFIPHKHDNLGMVLVELGQVDEAIRHFERAAELHARVSPPSYLASSNVKHARARLATGELDHARELVDRAMAFERERDPPRPDTLARALTMSASVYAALGHHPEATADFDEVLALHERLDSRGHPDAGTAHLGLAEIHLAGGRMTEAREALDRVANIWSESLPEDHWRRAERLVAEGAYWIRAGDRQQGRRLLDEGIARLATERGEGHWRTRAAIRRRAGLLDAGE